MDTSLYSEKDVLTHPLRETSSNTISDYNSRSVSLYTKQKTLSIPFGSRKTTSSLKSRFKPAWDKLQVTVRVHVDASICSLITQVHAGPLRAIYELQSQPYKVVMLLFFTEAHAEIFRKHVQSRFCVVNGFYVMETKYQPFFGSEIRLRYLEASFKKLNPSVFAETKVRRTLELFRCIRIASNHNGALIRCFLNSAKVMEAFSTLGEVIQVRPMFKRDVIAFAIEFHAVDVAVQVKHVFDIERLEWLKGRVPVDDIFHGFHEWELKYSKDNTERDCV